MLLIIGNLENKTNKVLKEWLMYTDPCRCRIIDYEVNGRIHAGEVCRPPFTGHDSTNNVLKEWLVNTDPCRCRTIGYEVNGSKSMSW